MIYFLCLKAQVIINIEKIADDLQIFQKYIYIYLQISLITSDPVCQNHGGLEVAGAQYTESMSNSLSYSSSSFTIPVYYCHLHSHVR